MTAPKSVAFRALLRPEKVASREFVHQVGKDLEVGGARAEQIADYVVNELERVGGSDARLVFLVEDGSGPYCSWCWALAGMCPHIAGGVSEHVKKDPVPSESAPG
ncbi:hypothetical protein [Amycolatopsis sp. NPDC059657]|uniref:hypothetical protein n=1 Tax=Amycolatopsis sp. NPDC059657 TaxID=3346899 RepID=UPI00366CDB49